MRKFFAIALVFLGLARAPLFVSGQDYLQAEFPPAGQASKLTTPFTPLPQEKPTAGLFKSIENPFIRDIDFTVAPRLYFRSLQNSTGVNSTFAGGGFVSMTTGWLADTLQLGVAGYTTVLLASNKSGMDRTGLVASDGNGFAVLGQAWGKLKFGPVIGTFYRQELELPFIHGDDSRIIPNTFEAYQFEITPWDFLRFNLGYVTRIKFRNSADFVPMSQAAGAPQVNRGTGFLGFVLGNEDKAYLEAITEATFDLYLCTYAQAGRTWSLTPDLELRGDLQFADQRSIGGNLLGVFATQFFGARLTGSYGGAVLTLAFNRTSNSAGIRDPYGADPSFTGLMLSNFVAAGENAYLVGLSYNFGKIGLPGLTAFSNYVYATAPARVWVHEVNATVDYRVQKGPLKNLWLRLRYANLESTGQVPINDFRVILNYSFRF